MTTIPDLGQAHKTCGGIKLVKLDPKTLLHVVGFIFGPKRLSDEGVILKHFCNC